MHRLKRTVKRHGKRALFMFGFVTFVTYIHELFCCVFYHTCSLQAVFHDIFICSYDERCRVDLPTELRKPNSWRSHATSYQIK